MKGVMDQHRVTMDTKGDQLTVRQSCSVQRSLPFFVTLFLAHIAITAVKEKVNVVPYEPYHFGFRRPYYKCLLLHSKIKLDIFLVSRM